MTIKRTAYDICKSVLNSSFRTSIKDMIDTLDKGEGGYFARRQHIQTLGYLIVDNNREKITNDYNHILINPLTSDQLELLTLVHNQLAHLDRECISNLLQKLPNSAKAIDPYSRYDYVPPLVNKLVDIIDKESLRIMANTFSQHPGINKAIDSASFVQNLTPDQYKNEILRLNDIIVKSGVLNAPKWLTNIMTINAPQRTILRHFTALTCIRESLLTLNQLIYQAILIDKLPTLDENNIINIEHINDNFISKGISVTSQSSIFFSVIETYDLVLIKCKSRGINSAKLCRVESIERSVSNDFGESVKLHIREVDDNLNPYGALLNYI